MVQIHPSYNWNHEKQVYICFQKSRQKKRKMIDLKKLEKSLSVEKFQELQELLANAPKPFLDTATVVKIPKGTAFIEAGEKVGGIYILIKGQVKAADYRMNEVVYDYTWFEPIELFGAMEFYMGYDSYITTLITMTDCMMITFTMREFRQWIEKDVGTMLKQIRVMMNRLNDQSSKERTFMFLSGQERLMYLLVRIYHEHAKDGECQVKITQEELANQSGINLRTATRAIYRLCEEKLLTKKNRKLFISELQCRKMEEHLKVIVDGGCNDDGEEENNFRL